ncbi:YjbH domain-containing protein [Parashewanella tropica]|uniref:YjbH domain-containing protein n=1 Tax=Parashewanella tropica TaxID=2547970 RepID=UPI00105A5178|nr:YjbH domain-containing protein [Parashewanella tropica]
MMKLKWYFPLLALTSVTALADEYSYPQLTHSQTDFGGVGLMQMPTARMMKEGDLRFGITNNHDYIQYAATLQLFPWFETTLRYTQVHELLYSGDPNFSGRTKYTDKSIDAKFRLWEESYWLPQVSVGFRDIGGTGLFDGEFIAANKRYGPLDFTLGVAWGYMGNRGNIIGDKNLGVDCGRNTATSGKGGEVQFDRMFRGCASLYGGIEYQTPYKPLRLKLEYDGNDYRSDFPRVRGDTPMTVSTPWNIGFVYSLTDWADLRVSYERGNTITAGITIGTNVAKLSPTWVDKPKPKYKPKKPVSNLSDKQWQNLTSELAENAGYYNAKVYKGKDEVVVVGEQKKYRNRAEAEERAAILIANTGLKAKQYRLVETNKGQPLTETKVNSKSFAKVATNDYLGAYFDDATSEQNPEPVTGELKAKSGKPWSVGLAPVLQQSFGGSEGFYMFALGVSADASYKLGDNWLVSGSLYGNIFNNYDKFKYTVPPDGTDLKRVRTLTRQYIENRVWLSNLQLTYFDKLSDNFYAQAYGGYLESQFAGAGTEVLYRPLNKNWAFGIDANYVKQRDPNAILGLFDKEVHFDKQVGRNYRVQTGSVTGNATFYYQPKFWSLIDNTLLKVSYGRYLTEDHGFTVDFSKRFDNGVIAGAFATKTNLSAQEFGEGSFTKGFYISIPFDLMTVKPSTERVGISWLPLQRDGGSMLSRKYSLYKMTDARSPWFTK